MTIEEFLKQLQECLEDQVSTAEINDSLSYYRGYYYEQLNLGKSPEEIFESLGSPRLIAHSIIDAQEEASGKRPSGYYDVDDDTYQDSYQDEGQVPVEQKMKSLAVKGGLIAGLIVAVIAVGALLHLLFPVIMVMLVVYGISKLLK